MFFLKADGYINQKTGEVVHDLYTVDAPASHDLFWQQLCMGDSSMPEAVPTRLSGLHRKVSLPVKLDQLQTSPYDPLRYKDDQTRYYGAVG